MVKYECYHGTSQEAGNSIIASGHFFISDSETEWAGDGIYFFPAVYDSTDNPAFNSAIKWAKYKKRFNPQCVIKAVVVIDLKDLLNLTDPSALYNFGVFRKMYYDSAAARARKYGVNLEPKYTDKKRLDCAAINAMCKIYNSKAVMRQVYIAPLRYDLDRVDNNYPISNVPNCVILCLREPGLISQLDRAL